MKLVTIVVAILTIVIILQLLAILKKSGENFAWKCEFIPPRDYYKDESILGDNWVIARGAIKQGF